MDEVKVGANQRFDLTDWTRFIEHIQVAFGSVFGSVFGDPNRLSGAAADVLKRPVIITNFGFSINGAPPTLSVRVTRGDAATLALVFDKDGQRVGGPNSATFRDITVTDTGGLRYIHARRLVTDTTTEDRRHYSKSSGKYVVGVDTETIDDWEIQESAIIAGTDVALSSAGWVDVATVWTDGAGNINSIAAHDRSVDNVPILSYTNPGDTDPSGAQPINLFEAIGGLVQMLSHIRDGRRWGDPVYDAAFDPQGGIRFAGGLAAGTGLENAYLRLMDAAHSLLSVQKSTVADADDLLYYRAQGFLAGGAVGGNEKLDPSIGNGFCYSSGIGAKAIGIIHKQAPISSCCGMPNQVGTPYQNPAHTIWTIQQIGTGPPGGDGSVIAWECRWNGAGTGASRSGVMMWPIRVPGGAMIYRVTMEFSYFAALPNNLRVACGVRYRKKIGHTNGAGLVDHTAKLYHNGVAPLNGGVGSYVLEMMTTGDNQIIVDNDDDNGIAGEDLFVYMFIDDLVGVGNQTYFRVQSGTVHYAIREASHVYVLESIANRLP